MRRNKLLDRPGPRPPAEVVVAAALLASLAACLDPGNAVPCDDGQVCAAPKVCAPAGGCAEPDRVEACVGKNDGTACDLGEGREGGVCRDRVCEFASCGDGVSDPGEECDDGNEIDDDACSNRCGIARCGDGILQTGEQCDDGAANGDERACTAACVIARCGDGRVWLGTEACDDGNLVDEDACIGCAVARCGDGAVWAGMEACDDGNLVEADGCRNDCSLPTCGDGVIQVGEQCDDGAANADDRRCTTACQIARCGDGLLERGAEACDDGNELSGDACRADCGKVEICGDGVVDAGEGCDDGNGNAVDGCEACAINTWRAEALIGQETLATELALASPSGVAIDRAGNLFIADAGNHRVRRVDGTTGIIITVAGTGVAGASGDGGPATSAQLNAPTDLAVDGAGTLFIADSANHRIRRVDAGTGFISTTAGSGVQGEAGDGTAAPIAQLSSPRGVAVDGSGNLYIADTSNHRIRRVAADTQVITTIAGSGTRGAGGDGGDALAAGLAFPTGVAVDDDGNVFIADTLNSRIRRVAADTGGIETVAGNGAVGFSGDGGGAIDASLDRPARISIDPAGNLLIADTNNHRIRRVDGGSSTISTLAGVGVAGFAGDGGPAVEARLDFPQGVAADAAGNVVFASGGRVRRVDAGSGIISTVAGGGSAAGAATTTSLVPSPADVAVDAAGNVFISDCCSLRRIDATTGLLTTLPVAALSLAFDGAGNLYVSDSAGIARLDTTTWARTTIAEGLNYPPGVAAASDGTVYIADISGARVFRVVPQIGTLEVVAGTGTEGFDGDGGLAIDATLRSPYGVAVDAAGNVFIADAGNFRIRRVDAATGIIETIAQGFQYPADLALDAAGNLYVADPFANAVVKVAARTGAVSTIAGGYGAGAFGDGGLALDARLQNPWAIAVNSAGDVFIADSGNLRVRRVDAVTGIITTIAGQIDPEGVGPSAQASLALPQALDLANGLLLAAGGSTGTVEALRADEDRLEVVAGRYRHEFATDDLARFRDATFGDVYGVAHDPAGGRFFLSETTAHRIHVVTIVDPRDENTWTIASLVNEGGIRGRADGPASMAQLSSPTGLYFDPATRQLFVADTGNHAIRAVPIAFDGSPGEVSTVAGIAGTLGFFGDGGAATDALLYAPRAVTRCAHSGDLFIADTVNNRVRRIEAGSGVISTVLGDGVAGSAGVGSPATAFPVDRPAGLACDAAGNVYVTSRTAVRLLAADIPLGQTVGVVDGTGPVFTPYGASPRSTYPASATSCLTGVVVVDPLTVDVADACAGVLVELSVQPTQ